MSKLLERKEERAKVLAECRSFFNDHNDRWNSESEEQYARIWAKQEELARDIEREANLEEAEADLAAYVDRSLQHVDPLLPEEKAAEKRAFNAYLRKGWNGLNEEEKYALQVDSDTAGGFIVPQEEFVNSLIQAKTDIVYVRRLARTFTTKAIQLGAPVLDSDPSDPDWTGEIVAATEDTTMDFAKRILEPHNLKKMIKVSRDLIMQSDLDAEGIVREAFARKFGQAEETAFLTGTGANQPLGVFTASAQGINTDRDVSTGNGTTTIGADNLFEMKYNLKSQYWESSQWIWHRDAMKQIHKLKDGEGRYLLEPDMRQGRNVELLLGRPVNMSEFAPSTFTTGQYVGILGDFNFYWVVDNYRFELQRLNELYALNSQIGYIGHGKTDGMPVLSEAFTRSILA